MLTPGVDVNLMVASGVRRIRSKNECGTGLGEEEEEGAGAGKGRSRDISFCNGLEEEGSWTKMYIVWSLGLTEYSKKDDEEDGIGEVDGITGCFDCECECEVRSSSKVWDTYCESDAKKMMKKKKDEGSRMIG